jgi:serine/threonine-protein phosphatase 2B catalytic subunit
MSSLSDPFDDDRIIKKVAAPPRYPLEHKILFPQKNIPDWKALRTHLTKEGRLSKNDVIELINIFKDIIKNEPNIVKIKDPVTIVGDLHGQFYDLLKCLEIGGNPENTKYLFLGDYVDRGSYSIEILLLLFSLKINYKNAIVMLRGNHECRQMTTNFNFKKECEIKYDSEVYNLFVDTFDCLPLACLINEKFITLHGGISPELKKVEDLNTINRFKEPPKMGLMCDILWSDPSDKDEEAKNILFVPNTQRNCSYIFGAKAAKPFLDKNKFLTIVRAHETQLEGFKMHQWDKNIDFPIVITIFSAPNYCDVYGNKAAVIKVSNNMINIQQYNYSPHPFILPDFMNIFSWSIPFVSEKISEMLLQIIKKQDLDSKLSDSKIIEENVTESLRMKVKMITVLMKMYRTLREQRELIMKLKGFCPGNKIPRGILIQGPEALKSALERYKRTKNLDQENEMMPKNYK